MQLTKDFCTKTDPNSPDFGENFLIKILYDSFQQVAKLLKKSS